MKIRCWFFGHVPIPLEKEIRTEEGFLQGVCNRCLDFIIFHNGKRKWVKKPDSLNCPKCGYRGTMLNRFRSVIHTAKGPIHALDYDPRKDELKVDSPSNLSSKEA